MERREAPATQDALDPLSFSTQVAGQKALPFDIVLGQIAANVYKDPGTRVGDWIPLDDDQLRLRGLNPDLLRDEKSGFQARIYTDTQGHFVVAFRGTDEGKDWRHNLRQGVGLEDPQYQRAETLAHRAYAAFGDNVVMTGHSLGGGLATVASLTTGAPAVTFNSAGVHERTIERLGLDPGEFKARAENGLIRRYSVDNEILTELQENKIPTKWILPDAVGHKIKLPDPDPQSFWHRLIPASSLKHGIDIHGMDGVLKAQQLAQPSLTGTNHPGHALYNQALHGLHRMDRDALAFHTEEEYRNAAGALASQARTSGLGRIDHVVLSTNGNTLFAVEGRLDDASHRMIHLDTVQAAAQPIEHSSAQALDRSSEHPTPPEREPRRVMIAP